MTNRLDALTQPTLFVSGPAEFLIAQICTAIKAVPQFVDVFGTRIDPYMRMDYGMRDLPALRVYNSQWVKDYETWYINGDVTLDVIMPPSIRREYIQQYHDTITAALCQQFRRPSFFAAMAAVVPGLNELGKQCEVDKTLAFKWDGGEAPITQIRMNFRLLLNDWDTYLVSTGRTTDDPFDEVLGNLERLTTAIEGLSTEGILNITVPSDQQIGD